MNCKECNGTEIEYDERLGEKICATCGFVIIDRMFEETISNFDKEGNMKRTKGLGSIGVPSKLKRLDPPPAIKKFIPRVEFNTVPVICFFIFSKISSSLAFTIFNIKD